MQMDFASDSRAPTYLFISCLPSSPALESWLHFILALSEDLATFRNDPVIRQSWKTEAEGKQSCLDTPADMSKDLFVSQKESGSGNSYTGLC